MLTFQKLLRIPSKTFSHSKFQVWTFLENMSSWRKSLCFLPFSCVSLGTSLLIWKSLIPLGRNIATEVTRLPAFPLWRSVFYSVHRIFCWLLENTFSSYEQHNLQPWPTAATSVDGGLPNAPFVGCRLRCPIQHELCEDAEGMGKRLT